MLKGIPSILSPELLKVLMEMGHGDEIVLADGNFPAASNARRLVRCAGHGVPALLVAVGALSPLDTYVEGPVGLMEKVPGDQVETPIWDEYRDLLRKTGNGGMRIEHVERQTFYERARAAYAVVATGEGALYANVLLKKGVVKA